MIFLSELNFGSFCLILSELEPILKIIIKSIWIWENEWTKSKGDVTAILKQLIYIWDVRR